MNPHVEAIASALAAVRIDGGRGYAWLGGTHALPDEIMRLASPEGRRAAIEAAVGWRLYANWFTVGRPVPVAPRTGDELERRRFLERLSAANSVHHSVEAGWTFLGNDHGRAVVERNGVRLWAGEDDVDIPAGRLLAPGDRVGIRLPGESRRLSPGFYMAFSPRGLDDDRPRLLDRFYFNLAPSGAVRMLERATRRFGDADLPHRLKVLDDPSEFGRCDSVVLATQRKDRTAVLSIVDALRRELKNDLAQGVPALTHPLATGLGFAEDPGDGASFGAHRCHLIAAALVEAEAGGARTDDGRLDHVLRYLRDAGVDPELPFRLAGSAAPPRLPATRNPEVPACR